MHLRHKKVSLNLPNNENDKKYSLIVSSDFDSGNMQSAVVAALPPYQLAFSRYKKHPYGLIVTPSLQPFNSEYSNKVSTKTFFHFSVTLKVYPGKKNRVQANNNDTRTCKEIKQFNNQPTLEKDTKRRLNQNKANQQCAKSVNQGLPIIDFNKKTDVQSNLYLSKQTQVRTMISNSQIQKTDDKFDIESKKVKIQISINRMKIMQTFQSNNSEINMLDQFYNVCVFKKKNYKENNKKQDDQNQEYNYIKQQPQQLKISKGYDDESQYQMSFNYELDEDYEIFFAYHFPYSYSKNIQFLKSIDELVVSINNSKHQVNQTIRQYPQNKFGLENMKADVLSTQEQQFIYYRNQVLTYSLQKRYVNFLTITSVKSQLLIKLDQEVSSQNGILIKDKFYGLPYRNQQLIDKLFPISAQRPYIFTDKPYIFISARVHPGQTSSSFALQGIFNMLLLQKPSQMEQQEWKPIQTVAKKMLKMFVFVVVPMVNPDGVYHGCYRMDTVGQNLNRFYHSPNFNQQPSIYAIQNLLSQLSDRIIMYIDFHAHPHPNKGAFFYGNAFNNFYLQVQSQLFAKLLNRNCDLFSYYHSSFSPQQMLSKDINQLMSKQGCGRVFAFRTFSKNEKMDVPFCYTLQLGYHGMMLPLSKNASSNKKSDTANSFKVIFTTQCYRKVGVSIILTLYQTLQTNCVICSSPLLGTETSLKQLKNVYCFEDVFSILVTQKMYAQLMFIKQETAKQIFEKDERFRMTDSQIQKKLKSINSIISKSIYSKLFSAFPNLHSFIKKGILKNAVKLVQKQSQRLKISDFLKKNGNQQFTQNLQQQQRSNASNLDKNRYKHKLFSGSNKINLQKNQKSVCQIRELTPKQFRSFKMAFPRLQLQDICKKQQKIIYQQVCYDQQLVRGQYNHSFKLETRSRRESSRNQPLSVYMKQQIVQLNLNGKSMTKSSPLKNNRLKKSLRKVNDLNIFSDDTFKSRQFNQKASDENRVLLMNSKNQSQLYNQTVNLNNKLLQSQTNKKNTYSHRNQFTAFKKQQNKKNIQDINQDQQSKVYQRSSMIMPQRQQYNSKDSNYQKIKHHTQEEDSQTKKLSINVLHHYKNQVRQQLKKQNKNDLKKLLSPFIQRVYESPSSKKHVNMSEKWNRNNLSERKYHRKDSQNSQKMSQITQRHHQQNAQQDKNVFYKLHHNAFQFPKKVNLGQQQYCQESKTINMIHEKEHGQTQLNYNMHNIFNQNLKNQQISSIYSEQYFTRKLVKKCQNTQQNVKKDNQITSNSVIFQSVSIKKPSLNSIINGHNNTPQDFLLPKITVKKTQIKRKFDHQIKIQKKYIQQYEVGVFHTNSNEKDILNFFPRKLSKRRQQHALNSQKIRKN